MKSIQKTFSVRKIRVHSSCIAIEPLEQRALLTASLPSLFAVEPMHTSLGAEPILIYRTPPGVAEPSPGGGDDKRGSDKPDDDPPPMDNDPQVQ